MKTDKSCSHVYFLGQSFSRDFSANILNTEDPQNYLNKLTSGLIFSTR